MIPYQELRLLIVTVADANERARSGAVAWGLAALGAGLARAERAESAGEPWEGELLEQWQQRYREFQARFLEPVLAAEAEVVGAAIRS
jgi:hypothetical protein